MSSTYRRYQVNKEKCIIEWPVWDRCTESLESFININILEQYCDFHQVFPQIIPSVVPMISDSLFLSLGLNTNRLFTLGLVCFQTFFNLMPFIYEDQILNLIYRQNLKFRKLQKMNSKFNLTDVLFKSYLNSHFDEL